MSKECGISFSAVEVRAVLRALYEAEESLDALIEAHMNPPWVGRKYMDWPSVRNWRGCLRSFRKLREKISKKLSAQERPA